MVRRRPADAAELSWGGSFLYICDRLPTAVLVEFEGIDELVPVGKCDPSPCWQLPASDIAISVRRAQIPLVPDFACTAHLAQGETLPSALVDLNIPPSGDPTAVYVALSLSLVRDRNSLFILGDFDASKLRRSASKAAVDILLQRLRGELADDEEGSKMCTGCSKMKRRSKFVSTETKSTRQWDARERFCLTCIAKDGDGRRRRWALPCDGARCGGAKQPRDAFSRAALELHDRGDSTKL
eukprot:gene58062-biopygen29592